MENIGHVNMAFDFGSGRSADVEFNGADKLWSATGAGISMVDVWVKGVTSGNDRIDLRVRVQRAGSGIEIRVDRGDDRTLPWWKEEALPRLQISINSGSRSAVAVASAGLGQEFQEVVLGSTPI